MALSINDNCLFDLKCLLVGNESEFVASSGENHASYCFCFSNADKLLLFWFDFGEYYSKLLFLVCILLKFHLSYFSSSQSSKLPIEILVAFQEDSLISSTSRRFTMIKTHNLMSSSDICQLFASSFGSLITQGFPDNCIQAGILMRCAEFNTIKIRKYIWIDQ